jgi:hypothetical protein
MVTADHIRLPEGGIAGPESSSTYSEIQNLDSWLGSMKLADSTAGIPVDCRVGTAPKEDANHVWCSTLQSNSLQ